MVEKIKQLKTRLLDSVVDEPLKALLIFIIPALGVLMARGGILMMVGLLAVPIGVYFIYKTLEDPYVGLMTLFVYNYFLMGITRYLPLPLGLGADALFALTYFSLFINSIRKKVAWYRAYNLITLLAFLWLLYGILEFFNPAAPSREAWFYAVRGYNLYFFLTVPLTFILFYRYRDLNRFLNLWAAFSLIGALKGIGQYFIGLDRFEQRWLYEIGNDTHNLITGLRIFSIFSDAGHYGSAMGTAFVVFGILALSEKGKWKKLYLATVALLSLYGMFISGTRGAMAVPIAGIALFILLSKQVRLMIIGLFILGGSLVFFKYTSIGEGVYIIRRMRTAFDPKDASLNTRLNNQLKFAELLRDHPFGYGLGSAGDFGKRFAPDSPVAFATDSWFVCIWANTGIIGLIFYLSILIYVMIRGTLIVMFRIKNKELVMRIRALLCGIGGIIATSYGNEVLGQFPTGIIFYMSICFVFMAPQFDRELTEGKRLQPFSNSKKI